MKLPRLFMLLDTEDQPLRAVFHGIMRDKEMEEISKCLNEANGERIKLVIQEKYKDADDDFRYTILTLSCSNKDYLMERIGDIFPDAKLVPLSQDHSIREIMRSVVII